MILLDTNVLSRLTDSTHPQNCAASSAVHRLFVRSEELVIVPQNLFEFWAVATRPKGAPPAGSNGLGMSCLRASLMDGFFPTAVQAASRPARLGVGVADVSAIVCHQGVRRPRRSDRRGNADARGFANPDV